jgi:hypothetical protein
MVEMSQIVAMSQMVGINPTCWMFPDVPRSERFAIVCLSLGIPDVLDVPRRASLRTICNRLSFTGDFQSPYIPYTLYTNNLMLPINSRSYMKEATTKILKPYT